MTIEETIKKQENQADLLEESAVGCDLTDSLEKEIAYRSGKSAAEHRQFAEWFRELARYRDALPEIREEIEDLDRYQFSGYGGARVFYDAYEVRKITDMHLKGVKNE